MQVNPEDGPPEIYVTWSDPRMTDFENDPKNNPEWRIITPMILKKSWQVCFPFWISKEFNRNSRSTLPCDFVWSSWIIGIICSAVHIYQGIKKKIFTPFWRKIKARFEDLRMWQLSLSYASVLITSLAVHNCLSHCLKRFDAPKQP